MKKLILIFYMLCAFMNNTFTQTNFDVFTYKEPIGYTKENHNGFVNYIKYSKSKTAFCQIGIYAAVDNKDSLYEVFTKDWNDLVVTPFRPTVQPTPEQAQDINGWQVMSGYAPYIADGTQRVAMLYTFTKKGKAADIVIVTNSKEFEADITALINSIKFKETPTNPQTSQTPVPATNTTNTNSKFGTGISGVWVSYTLDMQSTSMTWNTRVFFNNGTFLEGTPSFGCLNFKEDENNKLGTYLLNGNKGTIKMPVWTNAQTIELVKPNQLKIGSESFFKSDDVNGKTIDGSFTSYATSNISKVKAEPIGNRSVINFYSNGTFYDEGIFKYYLQSYGTQNDEPGKGTYSISEYTITLKYNDGRTRTATLATCFGATLANANLIRLENGTLNKLK